MKDVRRKLCWLIIGVSLALAACGSQPATTKTIAHPANRQQTIVAALLQGSSAGDWPVFGYDPAHTNNVDQALHPPAMHGHVVWSRQLGPVFSSPVAGLGMVFVPGGDGYLDALQQHSGALVWRAPLGSYLTDSTPALEGQVVFVAAQSSIMEALDAHTGHLYWRFQTNEKIQSPPLIVGQRLLVATQTTLWALSATNGRLLWKFHYGVVGWPTTAAPAVAGDTVYIGLGSAPRLWAINLLSGRANWFVDVKDRITSTALVAVNSVYIATWHGMILAFNRDNGRIVWSYSLNAARGQSVVDGVGGSMAWADGRLYFGDYRGSIVCLDAVKGRLIWRYATGAQILATPIIASGLVYIGSGDGYFYALDTKTGRPAWRYHASEIRGSAILAGNYLYIGGLNGSFYAFD